MCYGFRYSIVKVQVKVKVKIRVRATPVTFLAGTEVGVEV